MIFETVSSGGCRSYLVGCEETCAAVLIDPELSQLERYKALVAKHGLRVHYLIDPLSTPHCAIIAASACHNSS